MTVKLNGLPVRPVRLLDANRRVRLPGPEPLPSPLLDEARREGMTSRERDLARRRRSYLRNRPKRLAYQKLRYYANNRANGGDRK